MDCWLAWREEQLLWEAAAAHVALALKHTIRQGGRLPGSAGRRRSVPASYPERLTQIGRDEAESTTASDWLPLAAVTLHHKGTNPSSCSTAPRPRVAASILEDRALYPGGAAV